MKKNIFISLIVFMNITGIYGQPDYSLDQCLQLYRQHRYADILPSLEQISGDEYQQNSFLINYMLGTGSCRAGYTIDGTNILNWIIESYDLSRNQIRFLEEQRRSCTNDEQVLTAVIPAFAYTRLSMPGIRSKVYAPQLIRDSTFVYERAGFIDSGLFAFYPERIILKDPINESLLEESLTDYRDAISHFAVSNYFIVYGDQRKSLNSLESIGNELDETAEFYHHFYGFTLPDSYINAFVLSSYKNVEEFAERHHRIRLSSQTIGYTFEPDQSITGFIPLSAAGTLKHELFHLLLHQNFQAVTPWMDEGLSALYEVSRFDGDGLLLGKRNWRGILISENWHEIMREQSYRLRNIITDFGWREANDPPGHTSPELIYAVSRYFFLYLQEQDKLFDYTTRVISYSPASGPDFFIKNLEEVFDKPFHEIEDDFYIWLERAVNMG